MSSPSKNIFWLTLSRVMALALLAVAYIFLFRYLGAYQTGQHQFVLSFTAIFGVIVDFGIQQYIIKKMSEEPDKAKMYFQNFLAIEIVLAALVYGAMISIAWWSGFEPIVFQAIAVAGFGTAFHALTYPFLSVMSAHHDLRKVAFINFLSSVINVAVIAATIIFHRSIVFLVCNQMIFGILALILYYGFVQKHIGKPHIIQGFRTLHAPLLKKILIAALPFALLVGFSTIYNRIDMILISRLLGYTQNGLYAAAYKFFDLVAFFPSVVSFSLYPVFASLMAQKNHTSVRSTIEKYLRFLVALALPMAIAGSILARPIILLLAGQDFADAAPVLSVLIFAPAWLFIYIVANSLVISQLTRFAVIITGSNVIINIIGNLILLPRIGIMGAAIMTVFSELIQGGFYFYFVYRKITPFHFVTFFVKPVVASIVMALVLWPLKDTFLLIPVAAGFAVYVLVLAALRFFRKDDLVFLKSFLRSKAPVPNA